MRRSVFVPAKHLGFFLWMWWEAKQRSLSGDMHFLRYVCVLCVLCLHVPVHVWFVQHVLFFNFYISFIQAFSGFAWACYMFLLCLCVLKRGLKL